MGKLKSPPKYGTNQAGAVAKFVQVPPRKARLVMDEIRGKYVAEALAVLKFVPNFAARAIEDVIKSAVANAENSRPHSEETGRPLPPLVADNLKVMRCYVDEGPRIKRIQPRAQGRAYRILKRMCHITVIVEETAPKPRPTRRQTATRRAVAAGRTATLANPAEETTVAPELTQAVENTASAEETTAAVTTTEQSSAETPNAE